MYLPQSWVPLLIWVSLSLGCVYMCMVNNPIPLDAVHISPIYLVTQILSRLSTLTPIDIHVGRVLMDFTMETQGTP